MASTMRKHLDKIRFRGHRQDEFLDQPESHNTSDTECPEEVPMKPQIPVREPEELREGEGEQQSDVQVLKHTCLICDGGNVKNKRTRSLKRNINVVINA